MAVTPGPALTSLFLLVSFGFLNSSSVHSCPDFCSCDGVLRVNCSSAGLSSLPQNIRPSVSDLDLSNNHLEEVTFRSEFSRLQRVRLGNNSVSHLSLCVGLDLTNRGRSRLRRGLGPWRRSGCLLWAPALQLLSVERNQLKALPEGLGQQRELQILNLSFNKIPNLDPEALAHLKQLEELHIQNNHIVVLQPQILENLAKLKVLDLRFNLLTTLHPSTYFSLRGFGTDVALRGNSWICDCNMRYLRSGLAIDKIKGLKTWNIDCSSPVEHSGMELLELLDNDLRCPDTDDRVWLHEDLTVHRGSRIVLTCSEPDAVWWTPNGRTAGRQKEADLIITDITEQDEGLYVCMSKSHQLFSIFNIQIQKKIRKIRSVPQEEHYGLDRVVQPRNNATSVTQSHFAMAVSLSVIITFIIAFILGVILQPYICACWQKARTRKQKSQTTTPVPNGRQEEYINEAYLHCEDVDDFEPHRERRVTFSEYTEEGSMQYYDTVAGDVQEGNGAVIGPGQASSDSSDESGSEGGKPKKKKGNNSGKRVEFESIPDSNKRDSLSSQSSVSSKEVIILENHSTPNTSKNTEEQVQKTEVVVTEVLETSIESRNEIPGFSSEPFAEWSPHQNGSLLDPNLDNGDQFEFSDSARSGSPVSPSSFNGSFKHPTILPPNVDKKLSSTSSSSSSEMSDGEPTHYTVNPNSEDEAEVFDVTETNKTSEAVKSSSSSSDSDTTESRHVLESWPVVDLSSKDVVVKNELQKEEQTLPPIEQKPPTAKKRRAPLPPPRKLSSSSSDSENEIHKLKQKNTELLTKQETGSVQFHQQASWPAVDLEHISKVKRRLEFKVQSHSYESSSSSDSEDESIYEGIKEEDVPKRPLYSKQESTLASTDSKPHSSTSSSSESEEDQENYYENVKEVTARKPPVVMLEPEPLWPVVNFVQIPKVKRRLDVKRAVPTFDSSSSIRNSESEQLHVNIAKAQGKVPIGVVGVPKPESGTSSSSESEEEHENYYENIQELTSPNKSPVIMLEPEPLWPVVNLIQIPKVKRRLDFRAAPTIDSSSSSDSEDDVNLTRVPGKVQLGAISVPKPGSGTSSSSESDDDHGIKVKINQTNLQQTSPIIPPMIAKGEESHWPEIDLVRIPKVKRRLDIKERINLKMTPVPERVPSTSVKVPKPELGTSSSSDSEDEQEIRVKANQENLQSAIFPATAIKPHQDSHWPVIDLVKIPKVKQRLDIKATQTASQSSSSDSEDERVKVALVQGKLPPTPVSIRKPDPGTSSSSESDDEREIQIMNKDSVPHIAPPTSPWPVINLERIPKVKQRLDIKERVNIKPVAERVPSTSIKIPKPDSGTSSSSESEDEQVFIEEKLQKEKIHIVTTPNRQPLESQWPVINLANVPKVKRRLDIKENVKVTLVAENVPSTIITTPKPEYGTSSSSESEDEQKIKEEKQHQIVTTPNRPPIESPWPKIDLVNIPKVKQRLDIKERENVKVAPSTSITLLKEDSGTSSSSESEDERKPSAKSQWPVVDLVRIPKIKRRLDIKERVNVKVQKDRVPSTSIKATKLGSGSSSSSESEDEQIKVKVIQENLQQTISPVKPPTAVKSHSDSQWPVIDLVKIPNVKQRLDIKTTVPVSESSSSDSEDEKVQINLTQMHGKLPSTPVILQKPNSGTSSSSDSEDERAIKIVSNKNLQQITPITKQPSVESPWPVINLVGIPKLKQRLDIKQTAKVTPVQVPSTSVKVLKPELSASSSLESEVETMLKVGVSNSGSRAEPQPQWPVVDLGDITRIKRRLDFKLPPRSPPLPIPGSGGSRQTLAKSNSSSSSSSDEEGHAMKSSQVLPLPSQTNIDLELKGPPMKPGFHDSSSSGDDENSKSNISRGSVKSQDNKDFIKVSPILGKPHSPTKATQNIELDKYRIVTDDLRGKSLSGSPSPEVTPELHSKWATMNLGLSRFRKRLDITKTNSPSSPPPISPKPDRLMTDFDLSKPVIVTEKVASAPQKEQNIDSSSSSSESEDGSKLDAKSSRVEVDFVSPQVTLSNIPKVKRSLNVTMVAKKSSSSSSSDEETVNQVVPDLSSGIPQIKRRINIKAPTPPPSSSSSDDEKVYAHNFSDVTDQRSIEYKRTIMKSSSYDSSASKTQWQTRREALHIESNVQTPKKLSLDNIRRKLRPSKQNELPPNLRWTSVGGQLSEHPLPFSKRHSDGYTSPPPVSSPPPAPKQDSSDSSSSEDEQKEMKTALTVTQKTYNPRNVTFNASPAILTAANFEDRPERRGLSALRAMSSDRKNWESEFFTESAPVSVDYTPEDQTRYRRTYEAKTKMSQAPSYSVSTSSPATERRRLADMTYGIPSYKRHALKSTELPEDPPPPVPSSPLPDESLDYTWRSPQSSLNRGSLGYYKVQQKITTEESVDEPFYDNPNISAV